MEAYIGCRTSSNLEEKKTKIKPIKVQKISAQQLEACSKNWKQEEKQSTTQGPANTNKGGDLLAM